LVIDADHQIVNASTFNGALHIKEGCSCVTIQNCMFVTGPVDDAVVVSEGNQVADEKV
jgi:hypothetical protein